MMQPAQAPAGDYQGERTLMTTRPTRLIALRWWTALLVFLIIAGIFYFGLLGSRIPDPVVLGGWHSNTIVAIVFVFFAFIAFIIAELKRRTTRYIITDNKIIREDGILSKNTEMIPYTQLNRVDLKQSFGQRILGIGTIVVDTGDDKLEIEMIKHPKKMQELLSERLGRRGWVPQR
jgi:uncharacterized membrane protein YdbT with pleckstrin-like domain